MPSRRGPCVGGMLRGVRASRRRRPSRRWWRRRHRRGREQARLPADGRGATCAGVVGGSARSSAAADADADAVAGYRSGRLGDRGGAVAATAAVAVIMVTDTAAYSGRGRSPASRAGRSRGGVRRQTCRGVPAREPDRERRGRVGGQPPGSARPVLRRTASDGSGVLDGLGQGRVCPEGVTRRRGDARVTVPDRDGAGGRLTTWSARVPVVAGSAVGGVGVNGDIGRVPSRRSGWHPSSPAGSPAPSDAVGVRGKGLSRTGPARAVTRGASALGAGSSPRRAGREGRWPTPPTVFGQAGAGRGVSPWKILIPARATERGSMRRVPALAGAALVGSCRRAGEPGPTRRTARLFASGRRSDRNHPVTMIGPDPPDYGADRPDAHHERFAHAAVRANGRSGGRR